LFLINPYWKFVKTQRSRKKLLARLKRKGKFFILKRKGWKNQKKGDRKKVKDKTEKINIMSYSLTNSLVTYMLRISLP